MPDHVATDGEAGIFEIRYDDAVDDVLDYIGAIAADRFCLVDSISCP